jgi:hypothetical protein
MTNYNYTLGTIYSYPVTTGSTYAWPCDMSTSTGSNSYIYINGMPTTGSIAISNNQTVNWITIPAEESFIEGPNKQKQKMVKFGNLEGYVCKSCNEFCPMAELNLPLNNDIKYEFACYNCRHNY